MSERITAADLNMALDVMKARRDKWRKEHPDEKENVCPKCKNSGLIRRFYDEWGTEVFGDDARKPGTYEYLEPCSCTKGETNQVMRNNKNFASVPGFYKDASFDNFRIDIYSKIESRQLATMAKRDAQALVTYIDKFMDAGMGLYIYSEARGSGKTRLASTISNELVRKGVRNKFASASRILSEIRESWNDNSMSEEKIMRNYIEPKILIIDDFVARGNKSWIDEKFQTLLEARYQDLKITIFTSNYEVQRLPFDDNRIMDRLSEAKRYHKIKMPNESLRVVNNTPNGVDPFYDLFGKKGENKNDEG